LTLYPCQTGEVSLKDAITVIIPAGLANQLLTVTIQEVPNPHELLTEKDQPVSPIHDITANIPENFRKPVTLIIKFHSSEMEDHQVPAVFYYDKAKKEWVEVPGGKISGDTITVEVDHVGMFAVFAVDQEPGFSDIAGHWAEEYIRALARRGWINGHPDGTFQPDRTITRAEFIAIVVRVLGLERSGEKTFTDTANHWARDEIATAYKHGIVEGYDDDTFGPDDPITREQMAKIMVNAFGLRPKQDGEKRVFSDQDQISSWAKEAVDISVRHGLFTGYPDGTFRPQNQATRAEAAQAIYNLLSIVP